MEVIFNYDLLLMKIKITYLILSPLVICYFRLILIFDLDHFLGDLPYLWGQLSWNLNDNILKYYHVWSTKIWSLNILFLCLERDIRGLFHKIDFLEKTLLKFFVENSTQMKNLFYGTASDFEVEVFQKTSTPGLGFPENLNLVLNEAKVFQKTQQRFFQKTSLKFFLEFDVKRWG